MAETVVAAVILSIVVLALLNLFPDVMAMVSQSRTESLARHAAQNELERLSALPFDSVPLGEAVIEPGSLPEGCEGVVEVTAVDDLPDTRIKAVRVKVTFPTRRGTRTVSEEVYAHSIRR